MLPILLPNFFCLGVVFAQASALDKFDKSPTHVCYVLYSYGKPSYVKAYGWLKPLINEPRTGPPWITYPLAY